MTTYRGNRQQTVFDVALMQYGGLEGLALLLSDNLDLVAPDGLMRQFGETYRIGRHAAVNERIKTRMLAIVPCTGQRDAEAGQGEWVDDDGQSWHTDDDQSWETE